MRVNRSTGQDLKQGLGRSYKTLNQIMLDRLLAWDPG